jgi:hypothetical protein
MVIVTDSAYMANLFVGWAHKALNYFFYTGGTQEGKTQQEQVVRRFGATNVPGAASAYIM